MWQCDPPYVSRVSHYSGSLLHGPTIGANALLPALGWRESHTLSHVHLRREAPCLPPLHVNSEEGSRRSSGSRGRRVPHRVRQGHGSSCCSLVEDLLHQVSTEHENERLSWRGARSTLGNLGPTAPLRGPQSAGHPNLLERQSPGSCKGTSTAPSPWHSGRLPGSKGVRSQAGTETVIDATIHSLWPKPSASINSPTHLVSLTPKVDLSGPTTLEVQLSIHPFVVQKHATSNPLQPSSYLLNHL